MVAAGGSGWTAGRAGGRDAFEVEVEVVGSSSRSAAVWWFAGSSWPVKRDTRWKVGERENVRVLNNLPCFAWLASCAP
jgi:hypothetical protein